MAKRKKTGITGQVTEAAGLTVGAVLASKVSNVNLPVPAPIKPVIPILLGFFLMKRGGFLGNMGAGMVAVGGTKLIGAVAPNLGIGAEGSESISEYVIEGAEDYALSGSNEGMSATNTSYALAGMENDLIDGF